LRWHHKANNTIPRDSLALVLRKDLLTALSDNKSRPINCAGHKLVTYNIKSDKCTVEFLAEWIKDMNVTKSLKVSLDADHGEKKDHTIPDILANFHTILRYFSKMEIYKSDIHDSLIDWFITWLRDTEGINYNALFKYCEKREENEDSSLFRVCANVILHHGKDLLTLKSYDHLERWVKEQTDEDARHQIPGDVMDDNFSDHCAYHLHGNDEVCYEDKIRESGSMVCYAHYNKC
jgi:hypothetical protein